MAIFVMYVKILLQMSKFFVLYALFKVGHFNFHKLQVNQVYYSLREFPSKESLSSAW